MSNVNQRLSSPSPSVANRHRFCHDAMATPFEIHIDHSDQTRARQAAVAAFAELDIIEGELSRFIPGSDISRLNAAKPGDDVRISHYTFDCLKQAMHISAITHHAFDVNIGRLLEFKKDCESSASWKPLSMCIRLSQEDSSIHLLKPVAIDLGGIGKGFALDGMAATLQQWHIEKAFLHSGSSTVRLLNNDPNHNWPVTISHPLNPSETITTLHLTSGALACSGNHLRPHIINPAATQPAATQKVVWLTAPTAASADALATALIVMPSSNENTFFQKHSCYGAIIATMDQHENVSLEYKGTQAIRNSQ